MLEQILEKVKICIDTGVNQEGKIFANADNFNLSITQDDLIIFNRYIIASKGGKQKIEFNVYDGCCAVATCVGFACKSITLKTKVPQGQYYSYLNDAEVSFIEQYPEFV